MVDELLKEILRVAMDGFPREQDVAPSTLRHTDQVHFDERVVDNVAEPLKVLLACLQHAAAVVADGGHVFDAQHLRLKDSSGTRDLRVQSIAWIRPTSVIVEVGMPLARRASQSELHLADLPLQLALGRGDGVAQVTVEKRRDVLLLDDVAEVRRVGLSGNVFLFDRQARAELDASLDPGEEKAGAERAAAAEGVEETDSGIAVGEVGSVRCTEDCVVGGAARTAQLPTPSVRARTKARAPRAWPK
jgi:hypothetical protein